MANQLSREVGSKTYDNLFAGIEPPAHINSGVIRMLDTEGEYARGTVLAKSSKDAKLVILGTEAEEGSQAFDGDGTETEFTLTDKPPVVNSVEVNDVEADISSYDATTGKLTMASAPAEGTGNVVAYYPDEELIPDSILCDDTTISTSFNVIAEVYTGGNFNKDALAVSDGYTLTEADKDKLRERGIYLGTVLS